MAPRLVDLAPSPAFLPETGSLRRGLMKPKVAATPEFMATYEDRALVYDCFWHVDGQRVLLVGPPPIDLTTEQRNATFRALPGRSALTSKAHISLSQMVIELRDVPAGTTAIEMTFASQRFELPIRRNNAPDFAGRRLLYSMNQNNDLAWIREWASYHRRQNGTDAIVLFDNASTRYGLEAIAETLREVDGLEAIAVPSWPWAFGATDLRIKGEMFWSHFLQNCSMSVVLRRIGPSAHSILNCDIDELAFAGEGRSVHDVVKTARSGFITFKGQWIEAIPDEGHEPVDHRDFHVRLKDEKARYHKPSKWALDPARPWTGALKLHPYWHWLENRPLFSKDRRKDVIYWHFKGINTNWKVKRAIAGTFDPAIHEIDPRLSAVAGGHQRG